MSFDYSAFAAALTSWFEKSQRSLPWREPQNASVPYRVLVSEIMLQQTTVAAVIPYYHRFLERFPTVESLAAADVDEVMPFWAGLGYYSRARNLHACARAVMERHGGQFPSDYESVLALPGIGRYTAGAVLSIARNQHVPIVDANVTRVLARVFCLKGDIKNTGNQKDLWAQAEKLVQAATTPSHFNPAMMELGALICTPRQPDCGKCPVNTFCCANQTGRQAELPIIVPKRKEVELQDICIFVLKDERVLLRRRSEDLDSRNWWQGMWELPRITREGPETPSEIIESMLSNEQIPLDSVGRKLKTLKHTVTHHKITLECHAVDIGNCTLPENWDYFEWDEIEKLALPSVMKKLLRWLRHEHIENEQLSLL